MSMLFMIYIPVNEPEAYTMKEDGDGDEYVGTKQSEKAVSVSTLYAHYLDQIRRVRGGVENPTPVPLVDQPSPPPSGGKLSRKFTLGRKESSQCVDSKSEKSKAGADNLESSGENLTSDDVALIPDYEDWRTQADTVDVLQKKKEEEEEHMTLRQVLKRILDSEGITNSTWRMTENLLYWKVNFIANAVTCDLVLNSLITFGFGKITGTSMSLFSSSYYSGDDALDPNDSLSSSKEVEDKSEFAKSVKARLTVAQVLGAVKTNACITFDFLVLIVAASFIAAIGLAENSSVALVASMLISPMMGPTIGITFGICIKSSELWHLAVKNELIGLMFCMGFGYIFGLITSCVSLNGSYWGGSDSWPTTEMANRGMLRSLWVGVLTAIASGLGVALSILGGNVGSLVGVAISASLLPPAVNAGLLWGHATVWAIHEPEIDYERLEAGNKVQKIDASCPFLLNNEYQFTYSCKPYMEALILGAISILLTIINILCIFIVAIVVLKIKEVAPHVSIITTKTATDVFWRKDVPMVRKSQKKSRDADLPKMAAQFAEEYQSLKTEGEKKHLVNKWQTIIGSLEDDPVYSETTQHLTNTLPEIFRGLLRPDIEPLTESTIHDYQARTASSDGFRNPLTSLQEVVTSVGSHLWHMMPFTGSSSTKPPETPEPVPQRRVVRRSFIWTPSSTSAGKGHSDGKTTTAHGRFFVSPIDENKR